MPRPDDGVRVTAAADSHEEQGAIPALQALLDELLGVRGTVAAAVVTSDGEMVTSRAHDELRLDRTVSTITSALAAGQALGELLPSEAESEAGAVGNTVPTSDSGASSSVMLIFDEGPILLTPLANPQRVVVLALEAERDVGRARLALRGLMTRLSDAATLVS